MSKRYLLLFLGTITACSNLQNHEEPPPQDSQAALIQGYGSVFSLCGLAAEFGVSSDPICRVSVFAVDGNKGPAFGTSIRVAPGTHTIVLQCFVRTSARASDVRFYRRTVVGTFAAGGRYRIKAKWTGSGCRQSLFDEASDREIDPVKEQGQGISI
jgi:hypothetical protein